MKKMYNFVKLLSSKCKFAVLKIVMFSLFVALLLGASSKVLSIIIDQFEFNKFYFIIFALLSVFLMRIGANIIREWVSYFCNKVSESVSLFLQKDILEKIEKIAFSSFDDTQIKNLIQRIKENAQMDSAQLLNSLALTLYGILIIIVYAVLLGSTVWYTSIILLMSSLISTFISIKFGMDNYFLKRRQSQNERISSYYEELLLKRDSAKEVRAFNLSDYIQDRYINVRKLITKEEEKQLTQFTLMEFCGKIIQALGFALCLISCAVQITNGNNAVTIGDFVLVLSIGTTFFDDFDNALLQVRKISRFYTFIDDALSFSKIPEEKADTANLFENMEKTEIRFENVSFSYPGIKKNVLRNVNIHIKEGETIVCVGENGSGKTTFVNLLLGLYEPVHGEIFIGNKNLKEIRNQFRDYTASVLQTFNKYQMSIKENIIYDEDMSTDQLEFIENGVGKFIKKLPRGMDTCIGQLDDGAVELSGGQWQRLAVARALAKKNAKLLVMDEFTSALDPLAEAELYDEMKNILKKYTTIITSHRLGVCSLADRIFVFDCGEIVESGTHKELIEKLGVYYNLYSKQVSLYK